MSMQGDIIEKEPKMKRTMSNEREGELDRISTLPNCILLYIMTFMTTKEVVQTCVLSKRWKDLWKYVPNLIANNQHFQSAEFFKKFVYKVLLHRDDSISLHNIAIKHEGFVHSKIWGKLIKYALSHNVERFKVDAYIRSYDPNNTMYFRSIFSSHSLKYLDLLLRKSGWNVELPQTIDLPELVKCRLKYVAFSSDIDCAEPFSNCKKLSTLFIDNCFLRSAKILRVSSDKLVNLTIRFGMFIYHPFPVQISAPNLNKFAFVGHLTFSNNHQLFEHNLDFLKEARLEALCTEFNPGILETLKNWLKKFSNAHSLTLCFQTLKALSSIPNFPNIEPVHFGNLMSLIAKWVPGMRIPNGILNYLLQGSPQEEATIIQVLPSYFEEFELI